MFFLTRRRARPLGDFFSAISYLDLALAGDAEAARTLAPTGVGLCALTADRQTAAVAQAAVGTDLHQAFDVLGALAPEIALDLAVLDRFPQFDDLVLGQVLALRGCIDLGLLEDLQRRRVADPEDVGETDLDPFVDG